MTASPHFLDRAYVRLTRQGSFFREGWGEPRHLDALATGLFAPSPWEARLTWSKERSRGAGRERDATFESALASQLPRESRVGQARLILPASGRARAVVVLLGATGDEGFERRSRWAAPLLRHGVGALILENPLYGARRPVGQRLELPANPLSS